MSPAAFRSPSAAATMTSLPLMSPLTVALFFAVTMTVSSSAVMAPVVASRPAAISAASRALVSPAMAASRPAVTFTLPSSDSRPAAKTSWPAVRINAPPVDLTSPVAFRLPSVAVTLTASPVAVPLRVALFFASTLTVPSAASREPASISLPAVILSAGSAPSAPFAVTLSATTLPVTALMVTSLPVAPLTSTLPSKEPITTLLSALTAPFVVTSPLPVT